MSPKRSSKNNFPREGMVSYARLPTALKLAIPKCLGEAPSLMTAVMPWEVVSLQTLSTE
jgi:hypothetical protein